MKSKTSFFSGALFFSLLKRFWPLFAAYPVLWTLVMPVQLNSSLALCAQNDLNVALNSADKLLKIGVYGGVFISAAFAILFVMASSHYLYNARSTSMMGCLPVRRTGVFLSMFFVGLAVMLVSNLLILITTIAVNSYYGIATVSYALQWFGIVSLMCVFFMGFAAFCATLTGNLLVLPLLYVVLNFTSFVVISLLSEIIRQLIFGFAGTASGFLQTAFTVLSPIVYIVGMTRVVPVYTGDPNNGGYMNGYEYNGWIYLIVLAIVGIALTVAAVQLIRRRRMEAAGDVVAIQVLKPVFKYCLTFGCSLVIGCLLYYTVFYTSPNVVGDLKVITLALSLLVGAFVGYFAAQMLIEKTLKVFRVENWTGLGISVLVLITFIAVLRFDLFGYERKVPSADNVQSVVVHGPGSFLSDNDEIIEKIEELHRDIVSNREQWRNIDFSKTPYNSFSIVYTLDNGSSISRNYDIPSDNKEIMTLMEELFNTPEIIRSRFQLSFAESSKIFVADAFVRYLNTANENDYNPQDEIPLTAEEAMELYKDYILPDMDDGTIGLVSLYGSSDDYADISMDCTIHIDFSARDGEGNYLNSGFDITPTIYSTRTNAWLEAHGFTLRTINQAYKTP